MCGKICGEIEKLSDWNKNWCGKIQKKKKKKKKKNTELPHSRTRGPAGGGGGGWVGGNSGSGLWSNQW